MTRVEGSEHGDPAGWVLGALPPDEAERYVEHLKHCAACRAEVARLRVVAEALAEAPEHERPPDTLHARVGRLIRSEAELFRAAGEAEPAPAPGRREAEPAPVPGRREAEPAPAPGRRESLSHVRLRRVVLGVVAACALVFAGVLIGAQLGSGGGEGEQVRVYAGRVTGDGGDARAQAVLRTDGRTARLEATGLRRPPDGRVYQAWIVRSGSPPEPVGTPFSVGTDARVRVLLPVPDPVVERFIVTPEPGRGSDAPTRPPVIVVPIGELGDDGRSPPDPAG